MEASAARAAGFPLLFSFLQTHCLSDQISSFLSPFLLVMIGRTYARLQGLLRSKILGSVSEVSKLAGIGCAPKFILPVTLSPAWRGL